MLLSCVGERRNLDAILEAKRPGPRRPAYCALQRQGTPSSCAARGSRRASGGPPSRSTSGRCRERHGPMGLRRWTPGLGAIALRHAGAAAEAGASCRRTKTRRRERVPTSTRTAAGPRRARLLGCSTRWTERREGGARPRSGRSSAWRLGEPLAEGHPLRFAQAGGRPRGPGADGGAVVRRRHLGRHGRELDVRGPARWQRARPPRTSTSRARWCARGTASGSRRRRSSASRASRRATS